MLTILWRDGTGAKPVAKPPPLGFVDHLRSSGDIVGLTTRAAERFPLPKFRQPLAADESPRFIKGTPPRRCVPLATHVNREYSHRSRVVQETCRSCPFVPSSVRSASNDDMFVREFSDRCSADDANRQRAAARGMYVEFR